MLKLALMVVKDVNAAQDVLHNVAVVLLTKQRELADVEHYAAFLAVCIRRAALNYLRKSAREEARDPADLAELCGCANDGSAYDYIEWVASLEGYLAMYDAQMRGAFVRHYIDDIPLETIAGTLGITPNALSLRFKRMRRTLAKNVPHSLGHVDILSLL